MEANLPAVIDTKNERATCPLLAFFCKKEPFTEKKYFYGLFLLFVLAAITQVIYRQISP